MDIINAFKNTASQSQNPNNEYGWGIINTYDAAFYLTGITGSDETITGYQLLANYPNPFNPETTIRYQVKNSGKVNLAVFNSLGQKVTELDNNYRTAGSYQLTWNAVNLASGIYYILLETPGNRAVQKALLMK
jgi:hypothetical protein